MGKRSRKPIGRLAIDWLKEEYLNGRQIDGGVAVRDALIAANIGLPMMSIGQAVGWDRQARYELADHLTMVTQPVYSTGYSRNPNASPALRQETQRVKLREMLTRIYNQLRIANAAAAQIDATRSEIKVAAEIGAAMRIIEAALKGA